MRICSLMALLDTVSQFASPLSPSALAQDSLAEPFGRQRCLHVADYAANTNDVREGDMQGAKFCAWTAFGHCRACAQLKMCKGPQFGNVRSRI